MLYEKTVGTYLFSTEKSKLQIEEIHRYLSQESYWARNIPFELVKKTIAGSVCFGVFHQDKQVGFARVITDHATFGYLADVYILEDHRKQGLSKELMKFIMSYPDFEKLRRFMLATKDAHGLYKQFGFRSLTEPERFMELKPFESYPV